MSRHLQAFAVLQLSHDGSFLNLAQLVPDWHQVGHLRFHYQIAQRDVVFVAELVPEVSTQATYGSRHVALVCGRVLGQQGIQRWFPILD